MVRRGPNQAKTYVDVREATEEERSTALRRSSNSKVMKISDYFANADNAEDRKSLIAGLSTTNTSRLELYASFTALSDVSAKTWRAYLDEYGVPTPSDRPQTAHTQAESSAQDQGGSTQYSTKQPAHWEAVALANGRHPLPSDAPPQA